MLETLLLGVFAILAAACSCGYLLRKLSEKYPEAGDYYDEA